MRTHIISVLVENRAGVLARVAGLFSGRGYNIGSLTVGETEDPTMSRITLTAEGEEAVIEQVKKQLNKLIDVIKVLDLTGEEHLERELVLVKVAAEAARRSEVIGVATIFRANIVDVGPEAMTLEATGDKKKVDALLDNLKPFGVQEVVRTGLVGIARD